MPFQPFADLVEMALDQEVVSVGKEVAEDQRQEDQQVANGPVLDEAGPAVEPGPRQLGLDLVLVPLARREEAVRLYDERFCRMWEFYLSACEMSFRYRGLMVFQIQLARRQDAVPLTRDYIGPAEERLRLAERGQRAPFRLAGE